MIEPADTASAITLESLSEHSSSDSNDQQQLFEISASFSIEDFENLEDSSAAATSSGSTITPTRCSIPDDFVLRESPPKPVRSHPLFKDTLVTNSAHTQRAGQLRKSGEFILILPLVIPFTDEYL